MLSSADAVMYEIKRDGKRGVKARRIEAITTVSQPKAWESL